MDILLNAETHDIEFSNYDLQLVDGGDLVVQNIKQSLLFYFGEWFLNTTEGIPYFEDILIKKPSQIIVESHFKKAILDVEFVKELTSFDVEYINSERSIEVAFAANTDFGNVAGSVQL